MLVDLKNTLKTIQAAPTYSVETSPAPAASSLEDHRRALSRRTLRAPVFAGGGLFMLVAAVSFLSWKYSQPFRTPEIKERQLTTGSSTNPVTGAAISADGKYLAFGDNFGLHIRSLASGETRDIPN